MWKRGGGWGMGVGVGGKRLYLNTSVIGRSVHVHNHKKYKIIPKYFAHMVAEYLPPNSKNKNKLYY